jgi:hypothetical protein
VYIKCFLLLVLLKPNHSITKKHHDEGQVGRLESGMNRRNSFILTFILLPRHVGHLIGSLQAQSDDDESDMDEVALNMEPRDGFMDEFFAEVNKIEGFSFQHSKTCEEV